MCQGGDSGPEQVSPIPAGTNVRIKAGYFAGCEGATLAYNSFDDPKTTRVLFRTGFSTSFCPSVLESIPPAPEPARDVTAILAGIGRWQQQDPMKRRVHFTAEPAPLGAVPEAVIQYIEAEAKSKEAWVVANGDPDDDLYRAKGMREAVRLFRHFLPAPTTHTTLQGHVVEVHVVIPPDTEPRAIRFTTPLSAAEVVEALDHLVSQPAGTRARATTTDAEALAAHADRTPAYYGPAEGIS